MVRLADIPEPERTVIADLECPTYPPVRIHPAVAAADRHVAIISTAGLIVRGERPMLSRDTGYRTITSQVPDTDILCSHVSVNFDRTGFQQDLNVLLPRDRLKELEQEGFIGKAADTHYAFMGATNPLELEDKAHELSGKLLAFGVNTVVLAPV
ncbi:MAG: D-proline reductase (dithiol) PrdB [Gammaproteobacteria bacterium]|jgi:D-proline reductase (dithiol) PrdB